MEDKPRFSLRPLSDYCSHKALIFDESGKCVGSKKIDYKSRYFVFKDFAYNFKPYESSRFKYRGFLSTTKFYFYSLNHPDPLLISGEGIIPIMDSKTYNAVLNNNLIQLLSGLFKKGFLEALMNPKVLIPLIVLVGAVYYFTSGGSIT